MEQRLEDLPLRLDCSFRPWSYQVSHRRLVLRSAENTGSTETIDIVFLDVVGMKIRVHYDELLIAVAGDLTEIYEFVEVPGRHRSRYLNLIVSDGKHSGFVVCGALHLLRS